MVVILPIRMEEALRSRMCLTIGVLNWMCILCSLALAGLGAYLRLGIDQYTNLVENYDGDRLPLLLVGLGSITILVNAWGGFIFFISADPDKRSTYRRFLLLYVIVSLVMCVATAIGGILCFSHITHLHDSFRGGLSTALQSYREYPHLKMEIDKLQMKFSCCGNDDYTDWFHIDWVHHDYLDMSSDTIRGMLKNGKFTSDDVPFSCCSPEAHRPCIHHHVHDNSKHYNYDYRQAVTVNTMGCRQAIMDFFGDIILVNGGYCVLGIFGFQMLLCLMARYVQTSIETSLQDEGDTVSPSRGYLFKCGAVEEETDDKMKVLEFSDDEVDLEQNDSRTARGTGSYRSLPTPTSRPDVRRSASAQNSAHYMSMKRYPSEPKANLSPKRSSHSAGSGIYMAMGGPGMPGAIPPPPPLPASWQ